MKSWGKACIIVAFLLLTAAVVLLIVASVNGMDVVEFIKSWFETTTETPPVEETVETTRLFINALKM